MSEYEQVKFEELSYPSSDGLHLIHACVWSPAKGELRGIVQLSHGMCEYVQRYAAWARRFAEQGFVFCGNDHLGHGDSVADKAELGHIAPRNGDELLVEDVHALSVLMRERYPDLPLVLYGHSMGSFVARCYLSRYGHELAAAVISGTAGPGLPVGLGRKLAHTIGFFRGRDHRSKLLTSIGFGSYNKRFAKEKDLFSWLTRDKSVREAYANDKLCTIVFTTEGYDTLFALIGKISEKKWAESVPQEVPILLLSGDQDPVGNYGKGVEKVYERLQKAGCNVALRLYEGGRHEMHNELNADEVFGDLMTFFEENGL